jgi:uncharacterized protein
MTTGLTYRFEWDSNKERTNVQKHDGITFSLASTVLRDPLAVTIYDEAHSDQEQRWVTIGQTANGQTLVLVHTFVQLDAQHLKCGSSQRAKQIDKNASIMSKRQADRSPMNIHALTMKVNP